MPHRDGLSKIPAVRVSLRSLALLLLWLLGLYPIVLAGIEWVTPITAVRIERAISAAAHMALTWGGGTGLIAALLYPPLPAGLRLLVRTAVDRLRTDRGPLLRALGELRHVETASRQLEAGRAALLARDPQQALPHLLRAIELAPAELDAHYRLGRALMDLGRPDRAIAPLHHVISQAPSHAFGEAMLQLGRCHMLVQDHRAAADLLARHAREHGGNRRSQFWLGRSLAAVGDRDGARTAYATAAAPPPRHPRLTAAEAFYRARARVAGWGKGASS